ncbi:MAG TPA: TonB-dependent receptor [Terriglobales bacterium]|nr:TonB-dependent receptor [Terriglobales bacterium]
MRQSSSQVLRNFFAMMFAVAVLGLTVVNAQVDTGSITGTVADASGAVISGAKVTLTNAGTGATLSTTTGADGVYKFSPVRVGTYKVEAVSQGFQTTTQTGVKVDIGTNVGLNFSLKPGSQTETVEVTAATPVLQTQDASVGQVVDERSVNDLPLNGRNFTFLAQLVQGVNSPQSDTRGNAASGAFSANGFRPAQNNYMLDGIDNNSDTVDFLNGTNYVVLPPVDAIQEFKVQTTDFSAEYGRSGAAVLNATLKSGTNNFHGDVWEFFRNDKLDARDFFEHNCTAGACTPAKKGELRWNQFGGTLGGPVLKNKVFFFGDLQIWRLRQGQPQIGSVPTLAERNSGFTDFSDLITGQSGTSTDALGRVFPKGTIFDPATTRPAGSGFVRDPFPGNIIPTNRLDPNAVALLNLYPLPTNGSLFNNYANSPVLVQNEKQFDVRLDLDFTQKDQLYFSFSYDDKPELIPSIFGGVADGGGFFQGNQTASSQHSALVWNHTFSPTTINVARVGLNYLHTTRNIPESNNLSDLPGSFGILGIPQAKENGGLPAFGINGLQTLGGNSFLPSDEVSSTIQVTDDFTKIYGKHTFKMGFEQQHVKFSTLQPPWSRGQFNFDGTYTDVPNVGGGNTGRAQFLLTPTAATAPGTIDYVGGPNNEFASNISLSDNGKNYWGTYVQDDWKVSSKLTLNLGLRWDFFGLVYDHYAKQANFVPFGPPTGSPMYIIPQSSLANQLSPSFTSQLASQGIALAITNKYGKGLGNSQKTNFAPRFGFAYQVTPKFVARGGFGIFYNGFENRGYSPNLGENYPFQFSFQFQQKNDATPINDFAGCATATPTGGPTLETGFSCIPLDPLLVNATGLQLRGIQFDYKTPYSMGGNFTLQYQLRPSLSVQAGYVTTLGRHLEVFPGSNRPTAILPPNTTLTGVSALPSSQGGLQWPLFAQNASYAATWGSSYYHGLQTNVQKKFSNGLNFLLAYTYSKVRSDALDLLNGFSGNGYRAPYVPGVGIHADYGLANFDIRNVLHFSGGYELPFGKGKQYMNDASGAKNAVIGGWAIVWAATMQGGQPFKIDCPSATAAGSSCYAFVLPGKNPRTSIHINPDGNPAMLNAAAFAQPCEVGSPGTPVGCVVETTPAGILGGNQPSQIAGPAFYRWDLSLFKNFQLTERMRLEFRSEFFNILNHPNFNYPGFGGNGVNAVSGSTNFNNSTFGEIGSTRDNPLDPREIQFALKLYF